MRLGSVTYLSLSALSMNIAPPQHSVQQRDQNGWHRTKRKVMSSAMSLAFQTSLLAFVLLRL